MLKKKHAGIYVAVTTLAALAATSVACSGSDSEGESASDALSAKSGKPFSVNELAARATRTFTTPTGKTELCIIPKHFAEGDFADSDKKKEARLCATDFYARFDKDNKGILAAELLPKPNSTNPAVEVLEISETEAREKIASEANLRDYTADKIGVLKASLDDTFEATSCYAPSIVGYYETSRLLGNIAEVAPAVWRTLDVARHKQLAAVGSGLTVVGSQIVRKMWSRFVTTDASPQGVLTYAVEADQIFGAFIAKTSGDEKDTSIDTEPLLMASPQFRHLDSLSKISEMAGGDLKSAVTTIVPMQGVAEMLVLDSIMLQADRLSGDNVKYVSYMYYKGADGTIAHQPKKKFSVQDATDHPDAVEARKLYLNDVDAGLTLNAQQFQNNNHEFKLLLRISHMAPQLYQRIFKLSRLTNDAGFANHVKAEWRFTENNFAAYKIMVDAIATKLKDRCTSGHLLLDLDIDKHLAGTSFGPMQGCDGN